MLALLVVVAALAWPALARPLGGHRLRRAADQVRTEWTRARSAAITSGEVQSFRYLPASGRFRVERYASAEGELAASAGRTTSFGPQAAAASGDKRLPEGIVFLTSEAAADPRAASLAPEADYSATALEAAWAPPILFFPDGTATSATLTLAGERGRQISLDLRGLTCGSTVGDIVVVEDPWR